MSSPTYCTTEPATIAPNQGRKSPQPPGLGQRAEPRDTQPSSLPCAEAGITTAQRLSPLRGVPRSHQAECSRERREEPLSEPRGKEETRTVRSPRATRSARPSSSQLVPTSGRRQVCAGTTQREPQPNGARARLVPVSFPSVLVTRVTPSHDTLRTHCPGHHGSCR